MSYDHDKNLQEAKNLVLSSKKICFLTGAGVSAESGIATFRDTKSGLWNKFDPAKLASMKGFEEDPLLVWQWYLGRIEDCKMCKPNDAHLGIGIIERKRQTTVITQNVDDLHEVGGAHGVLHLHGDLQTARCLADCGWNAPMSELVIIENCTPNCPKCGALARPNVVWFGEMLDSNVIDEAIKALSEADLTIVVGTSGQVYPAAGLPWYTHRSGGKVISINTRHEDHNQLASICITGQCGPIIKEIADQLK
jgi:NAD-dependent deacetylase